MMPTVDQYWKFADEAMRRALQSKSEIEKQALTDLAHTWTQAALRSEYAMIVPHASSEHEDPSHRQ